jgi:hypothetical protein
MAFFLQFSVVSFRIKAFSCLTIDWRKSVKRGSARFLVVLSSAASPDDNGYDCADYRAAYDREITAVFAQERSDFIKPRWHPPCGPTEWVSAGGQIIRGVDQAERNYPSHYRQEQNQNHSPLIFKLDEYPHILLQPILHVHDLEQCNWLNDL